MKNGLLITVEGGEYTGKTTVVVPAITEFLKKEYSDRFPTVIASREPGGTPTAEQMRMEIFEKLRQGISPLEQVQLFNKARKIHLDEVIIPTLGLHKEKKSAVVLDRYLDSTRLYQGLEAGVDMQILFEEEKKFIGEMYPDITLILYIPEDSFDHIMSDRSQTGRDESNVLDEVTFEEHLKRQQRYLTLPEIAKNNNEDRVFITINTGKSKSEIVSDVSDQISTALLNFD